MQKKMSLRSKGCQECLCDSCKKQKKCKNCIVCIHLTRNLEDKDKTIFECKRYKSSGVGRG